MKKETPGNSTALTERTAERMNKDQNVYSSYIFASSNRSISRYGERLLMEVIMAAKEYVIDKALGINKLNFGEKYNEKFAIIDVPIRKLLDLDDSTNYTAAKQATLELMNIKNVIETPMTDENGNVLLYANGKPQYKLMTYHMLDKVYINEKPGYVSVKLGADTWERVLDMGKGYTKYSLNMAKSLNSTTAIRLFQIMSNTRELYFPIERLRELLAMKDRYKANTKMFLARVIEPAEAEIKMKCDITIRHETQYGQTGQGAGRPGITGIKLIKEDARKESEVLNITEFLSQKTINTLIHGYRFKEYEIRNNARLFKDITDRGYDLDEIIERVGEKALKATTTQGYIVRCLQNILNGTMQWQSAPPAVRTEQPAPAESPKRRKPSARKTSVRPLPTAEELNDDLEMKDL